MRRFPRPLFYLTTLLIWAAHAPARAQAPVTFTDVSSASGIAQETVFLGTGSAWLDFDLDGDLDAYIANSNGTHRLMRQGPPGVFTSVAREVGASVLPVQVPGGTGVSAVDTDNDGDLDIYVVNSELTDFFFEVNFFFRNNGDGTFTDTGDETGLTGLEFSFGNVAWLDVNRDGLLDVYLPTTSDGFAPINSTTSYLMIQRPDGTFINQITGEMQADTRDKGSSLAWDYDNDGDLDILFGFTAGASGNGGTVLYRYSGIGTDFDDVSVEAGLMVDPALTISHAPGDYDNDGDLDLYVCRFRTFRNFLYRNNGDGTFTEVAEDAGVAGEFPMVGTSENCFGSQWADFDNDGNLDLFLPTTTNGTSGTFPNLLYFNNGDGTFTEMGVEARVSFVDRHFTSSAGDYNRDGFVDLLIIGNGGGTNGLLRNDGNANHWLAIDLVGTVSNRSAIGARITLVSGDLSQIRELASSAGFLSQNSLTAHFGLGPRLSVDSIQVRWPNGLVESFPPPASVDQYITLTEGTGTQLFPLNGAQHFEMYD